MRIADSVWGNAGHSRWCARLLTDELEIRFLEFNRYCWERVNSDARCRKRAEDERRSAIGWDPMANVVARDGVGDCDSCVDSYSG